MNKIAAAVVDVLFAITYNELASKCQEANDIMDTALNESIDSLTMDAGNKTEDFVSSMEPEELGPTRELEIGGKSEV